MNKQLLTLTLITCIVLVSTVFGQAPKVQQQWEYKLEYKISEKRLNDLGAQGWELVSAGTDNAGTVMVGFIVFKRAKN